MVRTLSVRERLLRAMRGQQVDRIPNAPRIWSWLIEYLGGQGLGEYLRLAEEMVYDPVVVVGGRVPRLIYADGDYGRAREVSVSVTRERGTDFEVVTRQISTPAGDLRDRYKVGDPGTVYGTGSNPYRIEHLVKERSDLGKLRYLMPESEAGDFAHITLEQEEAGERALVEVGPTWGVDHDFVDAIGIDNCMVLYYEDREFFDEALRFFHEYHLRALHQACHSGCEVIFGSWYNFSLGAGWSPAIYREAFLPLIRESINLAHDHGLLYHLYDDGMCAAVVSDWADAGVDCVETLAPPPMGDVDLAEAKRRVGSRVCLKGNVDLFNVIMRMEPAQIREAVRQALQAGALGGRFILSTSDSIRNGTPRENVRAYMEAAQEFAATYL
jgi:hypothetical protein